MSQKPQSNDNSSFWEWLAKGFVILVVIKQFVRIVSREWYRTKNEEEMKKH